MGTVVAGPSMSREGAYYVIRVPADAPGVRASSTGDSWLLGTGAGSIEVPGVGRIKFTASVSVKRADNELTPDELAARNRRKAALKQALGR